MCDVWQVLSRTVLPCPGLYKVGVPASSLCEDEDQGLTCLMWGRDSIHSIARAIERLISPRGQGAFIALEN